MQMGSPRRVEIHMQMGSPRRVEIHMQMEVREEEVIF